MIIDSSAIVALILQEPGHEALASTITRAPEKGVGGPTLVECGIVLSARLGYDARGLLARFIRAADISIIPFTEAHFDVAIGAWLRFGKGRHPAALNFGDCLSYAVARLAEMPLLCVGDDFPHTDLQLA